MEVLTFMMLEKKANGLYNLGSGKASSFNALVNATFKALGKESVISYIDTPDDIREKYQYFTEANMKKLILSGYSKSFTDLDSGVKDYVQSYLLNKSYY